MSCFYYCYYCYYFEICLSYDTQNEEYLQDVKNLARFRALEGELYRELAHMCDSAGDVDSVRAALKSSAVTGSEAAPDAVQERLSKCAHDAFSRVLEGLRASDGVRDSSIAKAHVKLALLSDALLRQQEVRSKRTVSPALVEAVISNVFEGMQRLSPAARDRFPRLLELIAQYPDTALRFTRMAKSVPSWMFIRWISQMMAVLDKPEGAAVVSILIEIAKAYPQALYYPFRISRYGLSSTLNLMFVKRLYSENLGPKGQVVIEPLSRLLNNQLLNSFVHALENLTHPEHRWKDWQEAIRAALQAGNEAKTRELWHNVYADVFDPKDTRNGSYNQKFAKEWGKHVCALLGQDGSKLDARWLHLGDVGDEQEDQRGPPCPVAHEAERVLRLAGRVRAIGSTRCAVHRDPRSVLWPMQASA